MERWKNETTDALCSALLTLRDREECYDFLEDICTIKEVRDLSQRLAVARLLAQGVSYGEISRLTGASTATISRVNKCYEYGKGGYAKVLERLAGEEDQ